MDTKEIGAALALLKGKAIEQVPGAVEEILEEHPDWTTTVEDGAITKAKLTSTLKEEIETNTSDVSTLKNALQATESDEKIPVNYPISDTGKLVKHADGTLATLTLFDATDFIRVDQFDRIYYKRAGNTGNSTSSAGIAFYDSSKAYIVGLSNEKNQTQNGYIEGLQELYVPKDAVYARFSVYSDTTTYGNFELYGKSELSQKVSNNATFNGRNFKLIELSDISWTVGTINSTTGAEGNNSARIRSTFISDEFLAVYVKDGYKVNIYAYGNGNTYVGKWDGVGFSTKDYTWDTGYVFIPYNNAYRYRLVVAFDDDSVITTDEKSNVYLVQSNVTNLERSMIDTLRFVGMRSGFMKKSGTISGSTADRIKKYELHSGVEKVYISGDSSVDVITDSYCALWFVQNGAMMENGYVAITSKPQRFGNYEVTVPSGAEQVWLLYTISLTTEPNYKYDIAQRIRNLEAKQAGFFEGAYPWTKRVFGLRMLADAQGCYFIPFNALGIGVSRGNGLYGNSYIDDNIHPKTLGGYNIAMGVWSYLKNIPCWYTEIPSETVQPIDGTQWSGKKWYAYGTSLTAESTGHFADYVAGMSGLILTNKGYGGGALVTNRQIYNRLLDMEDGKLEADLITIEVGANDSGDLGDPWSLDTSTFYGALNHCIHEMFAGGVQAQIVIMASYPSRYAVGDSSTKYDVNRMLNT